MTPARRQLLQSGRAAILQALDAPEPARLLPAIPGLLISHLGILTRLKLAGLDASSTKGLEQAAKNWAARAQTTLLQEKEK